MSNRRKAYRSIGGAWGRDGKHRGLECDGKRHWNVFARPKGRFYSSRCDCAEFMAAISKMFPRPWP